MLGTSAYSYNDEYRSAYARSIKEHLHVPVKMGNVTIADVFHAKENDSLMYCYIGRPNRISVAQAANRYWGSQDGIDLRKLGFRDTIYAYGEGDKEYGLYSCAEKKWYSGVTSYCVAHGLK
jgi:hypothetical protein